MKLYTGVLLFLAGITCIASAQEYFVKDERNLQHGFSAVYMVNNYVAPRLQLSAGMIERATGNRQYVLASHYNGQHRLRAREIRMQIDGEVVILDRIVNRQYTDNNEIVGFEISGDILKKIGTADRVRVQIRGNRFIEKEIDRIYISRFGDFYRQHLR